ncbi:DUF1156 domain-containing protein [Bradyrhizobium sp. CB1717]|uniref:DUF1156 domain-containing protein n=1 Tax=Bradyrhizobium sp. CB1717 TaxID=3039154 RepID=UPI0024B27018|nr:DUF1156 domain-containing protein [Bradyrhizobium sp. CB1717]WFU24983.1 DUF1156 domain-containing protein [Bradyrhizobium sp. CB1717]
MATKKELLAQDVSRAVGAGKAVALETVNFDDPNRAKTCLEIDFPILPVNQIAMVEGNAGKPIYQMSKWWARRRSSVFRSMLIAAATKAPDDPAHAAKLVWDNYYSNHQKKGAFKDLAVTDIFMGGGTTLVEGSRLGMQMSGNDLNPVAWFVVKQEFAKVDADEVKRLLDYVQSEVKPQIIPFYHCDGPDGEKGQWTHKPSGEVMESDFDPLSIAISERSEYEYVGPEIVYTFWAKHGPCQVTGCGHRTPIMGSPVVAEKILAVKCWEHTCSKCGRNFDIEANSARIAPDVPLYVAPSEPPFAVMDPKSGVICPHCKKSENKKLGKAKSKKVVLTILVHPDWLKGSSKSGDDGETFGGAAQDDAVSTARWNADRAKKSKLLEARGALPDSVVCPETKRQFHTGKAGGTVPKRSAFACAACGTVQDVMTSIKSTGKSGQSAAYAIQGFSRNRAANDAPYGGRFFAPFDEPVARQYSAAVAEWEARKDADLAPFWPRSEVPYGFMTAIANSDIRSNYGFTHWWTMFNPRQLLVHSLVFKALAAAQQRGFSSDAIDAVIGSYIQILRYHCMFAIYQAQYDKLIPHFSNNNFYPKSNMLEGNLFSQVGAGNFTTLQNWILDGLEWAASPWEIVTGANLKSTSPKLAEQLNGKSEKVRPNDRVSGAQIVQRSSTDLSNVGPQSQDLVITDPPFGGLLHYSELSDFFYVWLRLVLKERYPEVFEPDLAPKALEVVANKAREPNDSDGFYQRLLTLCWREAFRVLKPGGILAFTFHHSEDEPWVAVLESLFDAGFYLEATFPIRSDETKGEGEFGSKKIEYDIIHVCRKRTAEPTAVSWARMRREVLQDVRQIESLLANHAKEGLPAADIQVIRRGKALEYFSQHYGKVLVEEGRPLTVSEALVGINQLIEEESDVAADLPPPNSEPLTRQLLRIFRGKREVDRDQLQKFLRGTGVSPEVFADNNWTVEKSKRFSLVSPPEFALLWKGRQRKALTYDYDQAWFLIGACHDGSGINAAEQLRNDNFKPHPALKPLLEWFSRNGVDAATRQAAVRAGTIYNAWADTNQDVVAKQIEMFA